MSRLLALTSLRVGEFVHVCVTSGSGLFPGIVKTAWEFVVWWDLCGQKWKAAPVSHLCPAVEEGQLSFIKAKTKTSVQSFWFTLKLSPVEPTGGCSGVSGPTQEA